MAIISLNVFTIVLSAISLSLLIDEYLYKTIPTIVISIPLILMYVAFISNLDIAVAVIYVLALLLFALAIIKTCKSKNNLKTFFNNNKFVLVVYLIIVAYFVIVNYGRPVWGWDEFSHWGRVVKNMNFTRHLNRSTDAYLSYPHYPPNASLFLYFFDYQKVFNEWQLFYAQSIYAATLIFPFAFYLGKNKKKLHNVLLLVLAISIPLCVNYITYISLLVDAVMGLLLGYAMMEYLFNDNLKYRTINIILALVALTLTKDAGGVLSIIFITIIFANELFNKSANSSRQENKKNLHIVLMLVSVVIAYASYKFYLTSVGIGNTDYAKAYSQQVFELNPWASTTIKNFYHKIFEYNFGNIVKLSTVNIIVLVMLLSVVLKAFVNKKYSHNINIILWVVAGFVVYLVLLLYTYICRFNEYESVNLASFDRYISTYLIFTIIVVLSICVNYFNKYENIIVTLMILMLLFSPIQGLFHISLGVTYNKVKVSQESQNYENKANYIREFLNDNEVVCIISIGNGRYNSMRLSYSLGPTYMARDIGEPTTTEGGLYSVTLTPNDFMNTLKENNFKYVFLDSINEKFVEEYSVLFKNVADVKSGSMFMINNNKFEKIGE